MEEKCKEHQHGNISSVSINWGLSIWTLVSGCRSLYAMSLGGASTKIGLATPMAPPCPQLGAGYSLTKCMLTS